VKLKNSRLPGRLLSNWHQKAIALLASLFIYVFYRVSSQSELIIPLEVKRPAGYELSRDWPPSVTIVFRGASSQEKLTEKDFLAVADLRSFPQGGTVKATVKVELASEVSRRNPPDFDFSPSTVEFVLEPLGEKYVPVDVKAAVSGLLPPGFTLDSLSFTPPNALIRGPKSQLDKVAKATIEPLDITGRKKSFQAALDVVTGNKFVRPAEDTPVKVSVVIKGRRTFDNVGFVLNGLRADLSLRDAPKGKIEVEGDGDFIENLKTEDLALTLDCRDVGAPGEYEFVVPKPELPAGMSGTITSWEPKDVKLVFERKDKGGAR
jgi:hypothetical protein